MSREDAIKGLLVLVFAIVLVAGGFMTIHNYRSWNEATSAVVGEYIPKGTGNPSASGETVSGIAADETDLEIVNEDTGNIEPEKNVVENNDQVNDDDNTAGEDRNSGNDQEAVNGDDPIGDNNDTLPGDDSDQDTDDNKNASTDGNSDEKSENNAGQGNNMEGFYITPITDEIFARIQGKSYPEGCTVSRDDLRYVHIRHYGFEWEILDGELIVNAEIAQDVLEIFEELYAIRYQIQKVRLIDEYDADDEISMENNNSSCFNYRTIAESSTLSNHAYGRAIDINPLYNPYVYERSDGSLFLQPKGSERYLDRTIDAAAIITKGDACYNIFIAHGFSWGGDWNTKKDYQHFEKVD